MTDFDNVRPELGESFAWCFSHGTLHRFRAEPWCTASWVRLFGVTEAEAVADKQARFGGAEFMDQLPLETQVEIGRARR